MPNNRHDQTRLLADLDEAIDLLYLHRCRCSRRSSPPRLYFSKLGAALSSGTTRSGTSSI